MYGSAWVAISLAAWVSEAKKRLGTDQMTATRHAKSRMSMQTAPLFSEGSGVLGSELQTPGADGFVRNSDTTLGQQVLNIAKAESESVIKPD